MSSHSAGRVLANDKLAAAMVSATAVASTDVSQDHGPPGAGKHGRRYAATAAGKGVDAGLASVRTARAARPAAAAASSGTIVDMAKALVARKRTPARSRNITLRLTGNSLEFFEILEARMGATPSDVFRDGLWIGLVAAERYVKRDPISLLLRSGADGTESDILDRGYLNTVERFVSANRVWNSRKGARATVVSKNKAGADIHGS